MLDSKQRDPAKGFTLLETMIALVVLAIGVLGLAGMLGTALVSMQGSRQDFIAQQKAEQAVEAIFTAKYTNSITWPQVANFNVGNPNGLFLPGPQPLTVPGTDGLVGTAADAVAAPDYYLDPGPDGKLGTADDIQVPLTNFKRTIAITNVVTDSNLRQVIVTVNYTAGGLKKVYTLTTYISAFD